MLIKVQSTSILLCSERIGSPTEGSGGTVTEKDIACLSNRSYLLNKYVVATFGVLLTSNLGLVFVLFGINVSVVVFQIDMANVDFVWIQMHNFTVTLVPFSPLCKDDFINKLSMT